MSKSTLTKIIAYKNNVFVAKAHNKRIISTTKEDGSVVLEFIRMLSKEEKEQFKDAQPEGNQMIVRGKVFVTTLLFTPDTMENLRIFLNVIDDVNSEKEPATV